MTDQSSPAPDQEPGVELLRPVTQNLPVDTAVEIHPYVGDFAQQYDDFRPRPVSVDEVYVDPKVWESATNATLMDALDSTVPTVEQSKSLHPSAQHPPPPSL